MKRIFGTIRIWLAAGLGTLLAIFAIQNTAQVRLSFLIWDIESRRIVVIALSFAIGLAIGWLLRGHRARRDKREAASQQDVKTGGSTD